MKTALLLAIVALIASACGTLAPESLAFADGESNQTTLRIATSRIVGFESAIASWEREHPTVDVEVIVSSPEDQREWIRTEAETNNRVDIIAFDGEYSAEARALPHLFVDLREHDVDDLEGDFLATRWNEGIGVNGELIALPVDVDAQALLVRNDLVNASTISSLNSAEGWCDVLQAGNDVFNDSGKAFFADGEEVLRAILSQSRSSWVSPTGQLDEDGEDELARAFNLALLTVGETPLGTDPCPGLVDAGAISRDLTPGESIWRAEIASDDFTAVISQWSERDRVSQSHPESLGNWQAIPLPADSTAPEAGTSSEGGLHFGIAANSEHIDVALDLLQTITNPVVQRNTFSNGQGPLPAVISAYEDNTVADANDGFFVGRPTVGAVWADAIDGRPTAVATPERHTVISSFVDALARVQAGVETPQEAWDRSVEDIANTLEQN